MTSDPTVFLVDNAGKTISLPSSAPFRIGRDPDNDLMINDGSVSRHHAVIKMSGEIVGVQDLGSSNGTFVNERRLTQEYLKRGDFLRLGSVSFTVHRVDSAQRLVNCGRCGHRVSSIATRCSNCQSLPEFKFCTRCANPLGKTEKTCAFCLAPVYVAASTDQNSFFLSKGQKEPAAQNSATQSTASANTWPVATTCLMVVIGLTFIAQVLDAGAIDSFPVERLLATGGLSYDSAVLD